MSTTPDIFLSYNREDQAAARLFAEGFARAGFDVWWDVTLKSGEDYDQATEQALRGAKAVVVLWSPKSVASRWVRTEATIALQSKTLVPVMIAPCQRPIMFELSQTAELGHWKGDGNDKAWLNFVSDVQRFVGNGAPLATNKGSESATLNPTSHSVLATKPKRNFILPVAAAVVAVAAVLFIVLRDTNTTPTSEAANTTAVAASTPAANTATPAGKSVAVLPFTNLSDDVQQEYFSDGLTEELLNRLAQVQDLQVAGRTSSFAFKNRNEDLRAIAATLGVAHILEGSVRKSGNQLRITAQLIKADDGYHLWSATYDRELTDIFAIQDEIAMAVTTALSITMGAGEFSRLGMTRNIDAYDAYLQGLSDYYQFNSAEVIRHGINQLERAVTLDPAFSGAWMTLIGLYIDSNQYLTVAQRVDFPERIARARATIRAMTPDLPALKLIAAAEANQRGELAAAEQLILEYIDSIGKPDYAGAMSYGSFLHRVGRRQEALQYFETARRLEPLEILPAFNLVQVYMALGRYEESAAEIERGLSFQAIAEYVAGQRMWLEFLRNGPQGALQAVTEMAQMVESGQLDAPPRPWLATSLGYWIEGDSDAALAELRRVVAGPGAAGAEFTLSAHLASAIGDQDLAMDLRTGSGEMAAITGPRNDGTSIWQPYTSELRKTARFKQWMFDQGLVTYWRTTGKWADLCRPVNDDFECF